MKTPPSEYRQMLQKKTGAFSKKALSQAKIRSFYYAQNNISHPGYVSHLTQSIQNNSFKPTIIKQQINSAMRFYCGDKLNNITMPTLIMTGDNDIIVTKENAYLLSELIPHAQLQEVANAGHLFTEEYPEKCTEYIYQFIKSNQN